MPDLKEMNVKGVLNLIMSHCMMMKTWCLKFHLKVKPGQTVALVVRRVGKTT